MCLRFFPLLRRLGSGFVGDKIFISYRRQDAEADAGRLHADLVREFGPEHVFKDVDDIPIGGSVTDRISAAVASSRVVLVLIGPDWSPERLSDPDDWVRIEIASALEQGVLVVPVLLRRARMPRSSELPRELVRLVDVNAAEIEHSSWQRDLEPLLEVIRTRVDPGSHREQPHDSDVDTQATSQHGGWRPSRPALIASCVVVAALAAVGLVIATGGSNPPDSSVMSSPSIGSTVMSSESGSDTTIQSRTTPTTTADAESPPSEVIPISVDGPFVEIEQPAVLSDDGYVLFPQQNAGSMRVTFTPQADGDYVVWARVRIPVEVDDPADGNSLFVVEGPNPSRSDEFIWDFWEGRTFAQPGTWAWDRASTRGAAGTETVHEQNPFVVLGRRGMGTVFTVGGREPGVSLDQVYVTNDPTWRPPECDLSSACSTRRVDDLDGDPG
jgi:hypothetical protein